MAEFLKSQKIAVCLVLCVLLAACGVRGSLEYPKHAKSAQKASATSGQGKPRGAASKPHKGFILDGLIN